MAKKKFERSDVPQEQAQRPADGNWYHTGKEGFARKKQEDAARKMQKEKGIRRFWMKPGDAKRVVFVDSTGYYVKEHNLKIGGKWGNFVTCVEDFTGDCKVCPTGSYPSYTAYYTIIDTSEYMRKSDGKKVKNQRVLLPAKNTAIYLIEDLKEKHGNLSGMVFDVKRYTNDEPGCGANFSPVLKDGKPARVNIAKQLGPDFAVPYDYMKILAAPTDAELAALGFGNVHPSIAGTETEVTKEDAEELDELF